MAPLVTQWRRACLTMQETQVGFQIQEDPKYQGANKPVSHNYCRPCALEPVLCGRRRNCPEKPMHHNWRAAPLAATSEKPWQHLRPNTAKSKETNKIII